jgi:hypothetical protein
VLPHGHIDEDEDEDEDEDFSHFNCFSKIPRP